MKYSQLPVIALFCIAAACSKKKDDLVPSVDPPVTNNPTPDKPGDSTGTQPKPKPVFTDFAPANAFIGDTLTLTGTDLGTNPNNILVQFGGVYASVISATGTRVQVVVPDDIEDAKTKIHMQIGDTMLSVDKDFSLKAPIIESMTPAIGFSRQFINITGKGFRKSYKFDMVTIGTKVIEKSAIVPGHETLSVPVPESMKAGIYPVTVTVAGMTATAPNQFELLVPAIQSLSATMAPVLSEVTIKGENFIDPNGNATHVYFFDWKSNALSPEPVIKSISKTEIKVQVPVISAGEYKVAVKVVGSLIYYTSPLTVTAK
jgi:hypothetical protein